MLQSLWGRNTSDGIKVLKRVSLAFFLMSLFFFVKNLFFSNLNLLNVTKLKIATMHFEELIEREKEENRRLKIVHGKIKSNPAYFRERFIREYLHMFKEGEKVIPLDKSLWYK